VEPGDAEEQGVFVLDSAIGSQDAGAPTETDTGADASGDAAPDVDAAPSPCTSGVSCAANSGQLTCPGSNGCIYVCACFPSASVDGGWALADCNYGCP
jgi:hypothetical protein